ncbi:dTDP-4-dehydrorhamnose reductase [Aeromonas enteropelogenes]|uniref:dTDP-4-dehydrorhamnose reductase n=1 Tax=Aeromonas enteropelogenes TaxID=29489 RepID=UPI003BA01563
MRILLLGARGQLGRALFSALCRDYSHWQVTPLGRAECDITDPGALIGALERHQPDVILNGAAYTAVDLAQSQPALAERINHEAVSLLAREASARGALLVHFSTDYVFDGSGSDPWRESDQPAPLNAYGQSKWAGEQAIIASGCRYLIIRTSWLHSPWRTNFLKTMLQLAHSRDELQVVCDQVGAPTSAMMLAEVTLQAIDRVLTEPQLEGLYHVAASGAVSWFDYARCIFSEAYASGLIDKVPRLKPITSRDYAGVVNRPLNSRLDTQLFQQHFGVRLPDWREGVTSTLQALLEEQQ